MSKNDHFDREGKVPILVTDVVRDMVLEWGEANYPGQFEDTSELHSERPDGSAVYRIWLSIPVVFVMVRRGIDIHSPEDIEAHVVRVMSSRLGE